MKKLSAFLIPALLLSATVVNAAPGDIAGDVYSTDIKTYFFGKEINSYNIGGQTVVIAEDLALFGGFDVIWDAENRKLTVHDNYKYRYQASEDAADAPVDYPEGYFEKSQPKHIYTTDIVTDFVTDEMTARLNSYNIGGYTCIIVEDLLGLGYDVVWDGEARELRVGHDKSERRLDTDLGVGISDGKPEHDKFYSASTGKIELNAGDKTILVDRLVFTPSVTTIGPVMVSLSDLCELTGLKCSLSDNILTLDTSEAVRFTYTYKNIDNQNIDIGKLDQLYLDKIIADGTETQLTFEWTTMMGMYTHSRDVCALVYGGRVFVPINSIQKLIENGNASVKETPSPETTDESTADSD